MARHLSTHASICAHCLLAVCWGSANSAGCLLCWLPVHAGTAATFSVTLENTGNVKWEAGGALVCTPALGLECTETTPTAAVTDAAANAFATDHILRVGHKVTCNGSFEFTQAVFESVSGSSKSFEVSLPSTKPSGWQYLDAADAATEAQSVSVGATVIRSMQGTFIDTNTCSKPANASSESYGIQSSRAALILHAMSPCPSGRRQLSCTRCAYLCSRTATPPCLNALCL